MPDTANIDFNRQAYKSQIATRASLLRSRGKKSSAPTNPASTGKPLRTTNERLSLVSSTPYQSFFLLAPHNRL